MISCIDVMYDLAFLLVDLLHRELESHANLILNRYMERTSDFEALALLPLFLSSRAMALAGTRAVTVTDEVRGPDALLEDLRGCLALAQRLSAPRAAQLVVVAGPSGSGKTTLARRLAATIGPAPGALVLSDDVERKRLMGVSAETPLGADGYSAGVTRQVYRTLAERASRVLREGHAVIVDAACGDPVERAMLVDIAQKHGVPLKGLWLDAPLATLTARLESRVPDESDATPSATARQAGRDTPPTSSAWAHLDAGGDPESVRNAAGLKLAMT